MKIGNLMKQAQQMQEDLAKAQESVKTVEVTGEAGAGSVSYTHLTLPTILLV